MNNETARLFRLNICHFNVFWKDLLEIELRWWWRLILFSFLTEKGEAFFVSFFIFLIFTWVTCKWGCLITENVIQHQWRGKEGITHDYVWKTKVSWSALGARSHTRRSFSLQSHSWKTSFWLVLYFKLDIWKSVFVLFAFMHFLFPRVWAELGEKVFKVCCNHKTLFLFWNFFCWTLLNPWGNRLSPGRLWANVSTGWLFQCIFFVC